MEIHKESIALRHVILATIAHSIKLGDLISNYKQD